MDVRAASREDDKAVLDLLQASMGWVPDEQYAQFFAWKHRQNPCGPSPAWVALDGERIVGFRTFLRWRFVRGGQSVEAVRAVDTATHPDYQGRGIFSLLTRHALADLQSQGVAFVFNTPNDKSRPGYLKMGWEVVRRLPVVARPRSAVSLVRLARARTPAEKWSTETTAGRPALEILDDADSLAALLQSLSSAQPRTGPATLSTDRSPDYLRWRYGFPPLRYRAVTSPDGLAHGLAVFRLRRRGAATEAAVCDLLVPPDDSPRPLLAAVVGQSRADYAVLLGAAQPSLGLLPVPGQGPTLVWRAVNETVAPSADQWDLSLGDIELF